MAYVCYGKVRTRLKHERDVGHRYDHGEEHREFPVGRGGVKRGDEQVAGEVKHVDDGRQDAAELGLAHLAAVRYRDVVDESNVEAHQGRDGVQRFGVVGVP